MNKYHQNTPRTILRTSYDKLNYKQRMELMAHRAKVMMQKPEYWFMGWKIIK